MEVQVNQISSELLARNCTVWIFCTRLTLEFSLHTSLRNSLVAYRSQQSAPSSRMYPLHWALSEAETSRSWTPECTQLSDFSICMQQVCAQEITWLHLCRMDLPNWFYSNLFLANQSKDLDTSWFSRTQEQSTLFHNSCCNSNPHKPWCLYMRSRIRLSGTVE